MTVVLFSVTGHFHPETIPCISIWYTLSNIREVILLALLFALIYTVGRRGGWGVGYDRFPFSAFNSGCQNFPKGPPPPSRIRPAADPKGPPFGTF